MKYKTCNNSTAKINKSWLAKLKNKICLANFIRGFYTRVKKMKDSPDKTIAQLANYYDISEGEAQNAYYSLWKSDGLSLSPKFNIKNLQGTEMVFTKDLGIKIPELRTCIILNEN